MTTELVREEDCPTHRLSIETKNGFKTFYLTKKEAQWISDHINDPAQFIVLPPTIDKNAPTFYPKHGAVLERMTEDEIRRKRLVYSASATM